MIVGVVMFVGWGVGVVAFVVALTEVERVEVLFAESIADIEYVYVVFGVKLVSLYEVEVVVVRSVEFLYILYPVTCVLSVDGVQFSEIDVVDGDVAVRLVGCVGGVVSGVGVDENLGRIGDVENTKLS